MAHAHKEIKSRIDLRHYIKRYNVKVGKGNKVCCPFHEDRVPSASVFRDGLYCYTCCKNFDVFDIVQRFENLNKAEALKALADETGVPVSTTNPFEEDSVRTLQDIFTDTLFDDEGADCLDYLRNRGFTDFDIAHIGFGCVPAYVPRPLTNLHENRRMFEGGYRLAIPLYSSSGRIMGYKYRNLSLSRPKYKCESGRRVELAFFSPAKQRVESPTIIVTEGELDAAMVAARGYNAVSVGGAHLDPSYLGKLRGLGYEWIGVCLDYDMRQRQRDFVLENIHEPGLFSLYVPEGKDPCEWLRDGGEQLQYQLSKSPNSFGILRRKVNESLLNVEITC